MTLPQAAFFQFSIFDTNWPSLVYIHDKKMCPLPQTDVFHKEHPILLPPKIIIFLALKTVEIFKMVAVSA